MGRTPSLSIGQIGPAAMPAGETSTAPATRPGASPANLNTRPAP